MIENTIIAIVRWLKTKKKLGIQRIRRRKGTRNSSDQERRQNPRASPKRNAPCSLKYPSSNPSQFQPNPKHATPFPLPSPRAQKTPRNELQSHVSPGNGIDPLDRETLTPVPAAAKTHDSLRKGCWVLTCMPSERPRPSERSAGPGVFLKL